MLYEGFDYLNGDLATVSGTWTQSGNNVASEAWMVSDTSLGYSKGGTLITSGGKAGSTIADGGSSLANLELGSTTNSGEVWISLLTARTGQNNFVEGTFQLLAPGQSFFNILVGTEVSNPADYEGFANGSPRVNSNIKGSTDTANADLLVMQILYPDAVPGSGNDGSITFWLNPDIGGSGPVNADWTDSITGKSTGQLSFDEIVLRRENFNDQTVWFDEIRKGASFEEVTPVPEPASISLLALGGLMGLRRRR